MTPIRAWIVSVAVVGLALVVAPAAAAHHVACGETVSVDTTLDGDLVDCPRDGIVIGAHDVRLNLNGHTIDGDGRDVGGPQDDGVDNSAGFDGVAVVNGRIREFEAGVRLGDFGGFPHGQAERNKLRGLALVDSDNGALVIDSHRNRIEDNVVDNVSGGVGIALVNGAQDNLLARNSVAGGGVGIEVTGARNRLVGNRAFANCVGIGLAFGDHNRVEANHAARNNCAGIQLTGADDNRLASNRLTRNAEAGIRLFGSDRNLLTRNRASRTIGSELAADPDGFWLDDGSEQNHLHENVARRNRDDGIDVDAPGNKLTGNRASRNRDLGIEAAEGVQDGGGNRARRNGNPAQCTGVFCS